MPKLLLVLVALVATVGCVSGMADPFTRSNEAMLARLVQEMPMGDSLDRFFSAATGKKIIFVNMESDEYTDDQLPEYLFLDAMYSRLTRSNVTVQLLERDPDALTILEKEMDGVELPATEKPCGKRSPCETETKSAAEIAAAKAAVAKLLREVLGELAEQDVLVSMDAQCCGNDTKRSRVSAEMVANEVGDTKSELILDLLGRYAALHDSGAKAETFRREVEVDQADYLFAYRIYEFGWHKNKARRISYIKLHYRIVSLETGRVVLSNFIEHRIDELLSPEEDALSNTKAKNADFRRPAKRGGKGFPFAAKAPSPPPPPTAPAPPAPPKLPAIGVGGLGAGSKDSSKSSKPKSSAPAKSKSKAPKSKKARGGSSLPKVKYQLPGNRVDLWTGRGELRLYDGFGAGLGDPLRWVGLNYAKGRKARGVVHLEVGLPKVSSANSFYSGGSLFAFLGGVEFGDVVLGLPIPPLNKRTPGLPALALSGRVLLGYQLFHGTYIADVAAFSGWQNTNVTAVPVQVGGGAELLFTPKIGLLLTMDYRMEFMRSDSSAKEWWTEGTVNHFSTVGLSRGLALSVHF